VADQRAIPNTALRSALEFVVRSAAAVGAPTLAPPAGVRRHDGRLPTTVLGRLRRAVEGDDELRLRLVALLDETDGAAEGIDEIGLLWLRRPDGWRERAHGLVRAEQDDRDAVAARRELAAEQRRRAAAEEARHRAEAERDEVVAKLAVLRAERVGAVDDVASLREQIDRLTTEVAAARTEARHARDREAAAVERADRAEVARRAAESAVMAAGAVRDDALADRSVARDELARLRELASAARSLADGLAGLVPAAGSAPPRRTPLAVPGRCRGDEVAAAAFLCAQGVPVLVDGYNVAKGKWPDLALAEQRRLLVEAAENLVRRIGTDITVVFDGADVVGAASGARRLVRVRYSPAGVTADDVIRDEVARLPADVGVVVVTEDAAIVADVRVAGANVVASRVFAALACA
jgi:hypothetical protein